MSAIVNAKLFSIVNNFVSSEETRYYLKGVLIQRHQSGKGVYLVATDGHRMMVAYDADGSTTLEDVIVRLDKSALAMCKPDRREPNDRALRVHGDGEVEILADCIREHGTLSESRLVSSFRNCIVDGTFPGWQRVIPCEFAGTPSSFNGAYLSDFGKAAKDLTGQKDAAIRIIGNDGGPALIRFRGCDHAFGILMPLRDETTMSLPDFYTIPAASKDTTQDAAE